MLEAVSDASSATCECSHLTAFAVLLPQEAYQVTITTRIATATYTPWFTHHTHSPHLSPPSLPLQPFPVPVEHYRPSIFVCVVLSCVCVLYLVGFVVLVWVEPVQGLSSTVHRNLTFSLLLTTLVMLVGVDRRELQVSTRASSR